VRPCFSSSVISFCTLRKLTNSFMFCSSAIFLSSLGNWSKNWS
jgi:hypothetical protein